MSAILPYIVIAIGLLILGGLVSLPVLLPPIRRWCRRSLAARVAAVCILGLVSFAISFALWTRLAAEVSYIYSTIVIVDRFDGGPPATGPAEPDSNKPLVVHELWRRRLVPPPLRRACYAREETICTLADTITANVQGLWSGRAYLEEVGTGLTSVLSTSGLVWIWTRTRRQFAGEHGKQGSTNRTGK